jgi:hypothetical protein
MPPVESGSQRRPLMQPPPKHIREGPPGLEYAMADKGNGDLRKRLEEQYLQDKRREGQVVFEDTLPYQVGRTHTHKTDLVTAHAERFAIF